MLKKKIHYFIFIAIGVVVIFFAIDFPGNKGSSYTMGPGFFPILVSTIFILLSLVGIFKKERRPPVKTGQVKEVSVVTALLILSVLLIQYVHFVLGIAVLLFGIFILVAQLTIKKALFISVIGSICIAIPVMLLGIPI